MGQVLHRSALSSLGSTPRQRPNVGPVRQPFSEMLHLDLESTGAKNPYSPTRPQLHRGNPRNPRSLQNLSSPTHPKIIYYQQLPPCRSITLHAL